MLLSVPGLCLSVSTWTCFPHFPAALFVRFLRTKCRPMVLTHFTLNEITLRRCYYTKSDMPMRSLKELSPTVLTPLRSLKALSPTVLTPLRSLKVLSPTVLTPWRSLKMLSPILLTPLRSLEVLSFIETTPTKSLNVLSLTAPTSTIVLKGALC